MSPALGVPGVFDEGIFGGTIVTPYGLESTAIVLPRRSTMNAVLPTTVILVNPLIVLMIRLPALFAYVVVRGANNGDNTSTHISASIPTLAITARLVHFFK